MNSITTKIQAILLILSVAGFAPLGATPPDKTGDTKSAEPIAFPDGLLDAQRSTAYVSSPKGGIQAIRLKDGNVLWTNDACQAQPWLLAGERLIARGERVVVLDLKNDGKLLRQCNAPNYPKVDVPDRCTVAFYLGKPRVVGDTLEAVWNGLASIDRSKGRPFNYQGWTAFNKAAPTGTATFNLATGEVALKTDPKSIDLLAGQIPDALKMPAGLPAKLEMVWQQYRKDQNGRITIVGDRMVGVSMTLIPKGAEFLKKIDLNAWDLKTGMAAEPVELVKGKAIDIANIFLTEDHRHAGVMFGTSAVNIYSLTDGKQVGKEVKGVQSPERAFVDGKRLYYSQLGAGRKGQIPNVLKAIDLETGDVAWERDLKPQTRMILTP